MGLLKKHPTIVLGLGVTLLFLILLFIHPKFIDSLDLKFYDVMMGMRGDPDPDSNIVLVEIDDDSIEKLGRWPWPRSLIAEGIRKINQGDPKLIGLNFILAEPAESRGLRVLRELETLFAEEVLEQSGTKGQMFLDVISGARSELDDDQKLADAFKESGRVVLPVFFKEAAVVGETAAVTDQLLMDQSIQNIRDPYDVASASYRADEIILPIPAYFKNSKGIGHINFGYDIDGTLRRERLLYQYSGLFIPSYTLKLAALYLNLGADKTRAELGSAVYLGSLEIPTTLRSELLVSFKGPGGSFKRFSFFDVINEKVPLSIFKNKLVLVGPSAAGLINPLATPVDNYMPLSEFSANAIWAILNKQFVQEPPWGAMLQFLLILIIGAVITFAMPRLKAKISGISFVALLVLMIGGSTYFFVSKGLWVQIAYP
ncbi:CHASE2 domain-containing protein, partial [Thermodesulfobacteriota bacterium]